MCATLLNFTKNNKNTKQNKQTKTLFIDWNVHLAWKWCYSVGAIYLYIYIFIFFGETKVYLKIKQIESNLSFGQNIFVLRLESAFHVVLID